MHLCLCSFLTFQGLLCSIEEGKFVLAHNKIEKNHFVCIIYLQGSSEEPQELPPSNMQPDQPADRNTLDELEKVKTNAIFYFM
jgi:hypothetical protein